MTSIQDQLAVHDAEPDATLTAQAIQMSRRVASTSVSPLTRDFLTWVASRPRSYGEAMEAWRSNCPRYTIWEDAIGDGLIRLESEIGIAMRETKVVLTPRGRAILNGQ